MSLTVTRFVISVSFVTLTIKLPISNKK